jgi:hypothetical protein
MNMTLISALEEAWMVDVQDAFNNDKINSEHSLQALLYAGLSRSLAVLPGNHLIFVEPKFDKKKYSDPNFPNEFAKIINYCPDLLIVNRVTMTIECIIELKCKPHLPNYLLFKDVEKDLIKLSDFSSQKLTGKSLEFDVFGPDRPFNVKKNKWLTGRPEYMFHSNTIACFGSIALDDGNMVSHFLAKQHYKINNFVLLTGPAPNIFHNSPYSPMQFEVSY